MNARTAALGRDSCHTIRGKRGKPPQQCRLSRPGCRGQSTRVAAVSNNKAAFITGCSTGIGKEASLLLAQQGWRVFSGVRQQADADNLKQLHEGITPMLLDVTSEQSLTAAQQAVQQQLGGSGLNLLVNNAGVGLVAPAEYVPLQQWRQVLDVNLQGPLAVTQAFLPLLRQAQPQPGRIINISSVAGHLALPFWSAYNVSKAGLDMLTDCLRYELQPQGLTVVLIKPGPVSTPIWDKSRQRSEALLDTLPPGAQQLYGPALGKLRVAIAKTEEDSIPAADVAQLIVEAATASQPKSTYLIGNNAALVYWLKRLMPDALWAGFVQIP